LAGILDHDAVDDEPFARLEIDGERHSTALGNEPGVGSTPARLPKA
jgi:hypothetical protein